MINVPTPVVQGDRLFVSSFYDGSLMLKLRQDEPAVEQVWRRKGKSEIVTDALHAMISTPYLEGDYIYGVDSYGQLRCLDAATGDRVWEDLTAVPKNRWANIHLIRHEGTVPIFGSTKMGLSRSRSDGEIWMFNELGELIISTLSPQGFHEISRTKLIEPTREQLPRGQGVCWSHPAFAYKHVFARNDRELVCAAWRPRSGRNVLLSLRERQCKSRPGLTRSVRNTACYCRSVGWQQAELVHSGATTLRCRLLALRPADRSPPV